MWCASNWTHSMAPLKTQCRRIFNLWFQLESASTKTGADSDQKEICPQIWPVQAFWAHLMQRVSHQSWFTSMRKTNKLVPYILDPVYPTCKMNSLLCDIWQPASLQLRWFASRKATDRSQGSFKKCSGSSKIIRIFDSLRTQLPLVRNLKNICNASLPSPHTNTVLPWQPIAN